MGGEPEYTVAEGDGPVNALDAALRKALRPFYPQIDEIKLDDYKVRIINGQQGTAARTRVLIVSTDGQTSWGTVGVSRQHHRSELARAGGQLRVPLSRMNPELPMHAVLVILR